MKLALALLFLTTWGVPGYPEMECRAVNASLVFRHHYPVPIRFEYTVCSGWDLGPCVTDKTDWIKPDTDVVLHAPGFSDGWTDLEIKWLEKKKK
jgi:hypothetical protein